MFVFGRTGNSIIEVIIVMLILSLGITGTYQIVSNGTYLANTTENRIQAINLAREGLEDVVNIRNTNWMKLSADYDNCWRVADYNSICIGGSATSLAQNILTDPYVVPVLDQTLWYLTGSTHSGVYLDAQGLPYQSGGTVALPACRAAGLSTNCQTPFYRTIAIDYPDANHMHIVSTVDWSDVSKSHGKYTVSLETTLTNWKRHLP